MRSRTLITLILLVLSLTGKVCGEALTAEADGIKMIVEIGFLSGTGNDAAILDGNIYLKNTSRMTKKLVTGDVLGPRYSTGLIFYSVAISTGPDNEPLKPSPAKLDVVELKPGEMLALQHFRCLERKSANRKYRISYRVDAALRKFYPDVWTNDLSVEIDR